MYVCVCCLWLQGMHRAHKHTRAQRESAVCLANYCFIIQKWQAFEHSGRWNNKAASERDLPPPPTITHTTDRLLLARQHTTWAINNLLIMITARRYISVSAAAASAACSAFATEPCVCLLLCRSGQVCSSQRIGSRSTPFVIELNLHAPHPLFHCVHTLVSAAWCAPQTADCPHTPGRF
jgi:hypothetical protein